MTFREKLMQEHPEKTGKCYLGGCAGCPREYGWDNYDCGSWGEDTICRACWDREIPGTEPSAKAGSLCFGLEVRNCTECPRAGGLRLCEVDGQACYFHRFIEEELGVLQINDNIVLGVSQVTRLIRDFEERRIVANCCSLEKLRHAWALVEFPDGSVKKVEPEKVRFLDREDWSHE